MSAPAITKKITLKKVMRRLKRYMYKYIPHNTQYRPAQSQDSIKEYLQTSGKSKGCYLEIFPDHVTNLRTSPEFKRALSSYTIYDRWSEEDTLTLTTQTTYFLVKIPNARLYTNNIDLVSIISEDNILLGDISLQYIAATDSAAKGSESPIFQQKYFVKPKKYKGTVFSMLSGGASTFNYGHWLVDVIPRIHLLKLSGWFDEVDYFLVPSYRKDYEIDMLNLLGIDASRVIESNEQLHIQADAIIASSHPRGEYSYLIPRWVTDYLNQTYVNKHILRNDVDFPPFIYISRSDSGLRKVTNEGEVMDLLSKYGFKMFILSQMSFADKVNLFYNARVIVAGSGAGLSNLLFCQKNTRLVEIFSEGYVQSFFYNIASFMELDHHFIVCKSPSPATVMRDGLIEDITVDIPQLKRKVEEVMINEL